MDNRFYLQALGITTLFIVLLLVIWVTSGGPASEAEIRNANSTRTAIAATEVFLLKPRPTRTPQSFTIPNFVTPANVTPTSTPGSTSAREPFFPSTGTLRPNATAIVQTPGIPETGVQSPVEFARWYFGHVWQERDYQNLWDNYLTASFKSHVGSGLFEDYVAWWDSVKRVDVKSADVIENNGMNAWVRVNLTLHMKNGHVLPDQIFDYDFLYDASRDTWMFDYSP